jgi:hypothetical protein
MVARNKFPESCMKINEKLKASDSCKIQEFALNKEK